MYQIEEDTIIHIIQLSSNPKKCKCCTLLTFCYVGDFDKLFELLKIMCFKHFGPGSLFYPYIFFSFNMTKQFQDLWIFMTILVRLNFTYLILCHILLLLVMFCLFCFCVQCGCLKPHKCLIRDYNDVF